MVPGGGLPEPPPVEPLGPSLLPELPQPAKTRPKHVKISRREMRALKQSLPPPVADLSCVNWNCSCSWRRHSAYRRQCCLHSARLLGSLHYASRRGLLAADEF